MEVLADLDEIDDPDKVRRTGDNQPQFLHGRDIRLGQGFALDLKFRDPCGENVPLEPRDDLLVDVLDGDEGVAASGDDVEEEVSPAVGVEVQPVQWLGVAYTPNTLYTVDTCTLYNGPQYAEHIPGCKGSRDYA